MDVLQNHFYLIKIALYTQNSFFSPFCHKQKLDFKIVIMRNIIVIPEQVVMEVEKVKVRMEEVVVLGLRLVVEVHEVEVQVEVEVRMQVQ